MRRFTRDDNPRPRKRHAPSVQGLGVLDNIGIPKASASTILTPVLDKSVQPFTFVCDPRRLSTSRLHTTALSSRPEQSTFSSGVLTELGADKLAEAFKTPFHGVSLDNVEIKGLSSVYLAHPATECYLASLITADADSTPRVADGDPQAEEAGANPTIENAEEPSIAKRIRNLWTVHLFLSSESGIDANAL
ncbi:unnamed protein product [Peniophora sp. CBMAI 1063]|nr:unnamed protein product [Peniophora sp. CBMAI 1063]